MVAATLFLPSRIDKKEVGPMPRSEESKRQKKMVSCEMNKTDVEALNAKAKTLGRSRSDVMREAITKYLYYKGA